MKLQKTIKTEAKIAGRGLFEGREVKVVFRPADADTGVVFIRTDVAEPVRIGAVVATVIVSTRGVTRTSNSWNLYMTGLRASRIGYTSLHITNIATV